MLTTHFESSVHAAARAVAQARQGCAPGFEWSAQGDEEREALVEGLPLWLSLKRGWIYLAENQAWPGLYKIGCTRKTVVERLAELSGTGVATPWRRLRSWGAYDAHGLEALAHAACEPWHVRGELFAGDPKIIASAVGRAIQVDRVRLLRQLGAVFVPGRLDELLDAASGMVGSAHTTVAYTS